VWGDDLQGELYAAARARQLTSVVIQPILLRGVRLGTVMFGTAGQRRGLRPGDVLTVSDLAARLGVAIERVMLGAETQQAAVRAARHALQLQRLAEAAAAIHAALDTDDVALVLAQQARLVFDAGAARVNLRTEGRRTRRAASVGRAPKSSLQIESPMTQPSGGVVGSVEVLREGAAFSPDEEAVLASLAQIASVALANARLYADVHDREARLRAMYDTAPIGIVELDAEGRGLRWNHAAEALFGWPPCDDDAAGNVRLPDAAMPIVAQVLAEDGPVTSVDVALPNADAELVAVPLSGAGGRTEVMLAGLDLTERNQVAEQLQLAQRMEAMASVSGGIAHDFNNVLMVITGYTDLILRRELDDDMRADVEAMRAAAKRAADFTRKLLTISRRQLVQPQQVDVTEAVEALRDVLGVMLGSGIDLEVSLGDVPPVWIDPAQFEQVVINLAMNARDAMPEGGRLTVAADPSARGVVLTVADTGQGMDAAAVEHCFEPFFTTKDRTKGTGLGLSTVYGIVTQAGGEVAVESKPGVGTTFCVELPAAEGVKPMRSDRPLRVLVVDDEPDVRAVVTDMLEFAGHEVLAVADGPTALKQLKRFRPEVLLTDVVMPDMRGPELAQRAVELRKRLRVVLMSSHVDDEEALRGLPERTTFLAKPFSPETLADALAGATEGQGSKR
jgi:signal transduction histidine kinase/CheY-like chemotaxis protein